MSIFRGTNEISKIYRGTNEIVKVYRGVNLIFTSALPQYELIADVDVTMATTQIDFDNLNITKDDELRLVYTFVGSAFSTINVFANNDTNQANYTSQLLYAAGTTIIARRDSDGRISETSKTSGFMDIKISNNDRFVGQSQMLRTAGGASGIEMLNWNLAGTSTVTSITAINIVSQTTNQIGVGTKLQLYKVNTGVA